MVALEKTFVTSSKPMVLYTINCCLLFVQCCQANKQADQICYAVLCVFSYIAAGTEQRKRREAAVQEAIQCREQRK